MQGKLDNRMTMMGRVGGTENGKARLDVQASARRQRALTQHLTELLVGAIHAPSDTDRPSHAEHFVIRWICVRGP